MTAYTDTEYGMFNGEKEPSYRPLYLVIYDFFPCGSASTALYTDPQKADAAAAGIVHEVLELHHPELYHLRKLPWREAQQALLDKNIPCAVHCEKIWLDDPRVDEMQKSYLSGKD